MLPAFHLLVSWEFEGVKHIPATGRWPWLAWNLNIQGDDYQQGKNCEQKESPVQPRGVSEQPQCAFGTGMLCAGYFCSPTASYS